MESSAESVVELNFLQPRFRPIQASMPLAESVNNRKPFVLFGSRRIGQPRDSFHVDRGNEPGRERMAHDDCETFQFEVIRSKKLP